MKNDKTFLVGSLIDPPNKYIAVCNRVGEIIKHIDLDKPQQTLFVDNQELVPSPVKDPNQTQINFSDKELFQQKTILIQLREDLQIIDTDFNEALAIIVKN